MKAILKTILFFIGLFAVWISHHLTIIGLGLFFGNIKRMDYEGEFLFLTLKSLFFTPSFIFLFFWVFLFYMSLSLSGLLERIKNVILFLIFSLAGGAAYSLMAWAFSSEVTITGSGSQSDYVYAGLIAYMLSAPLFGFLLRWAFKNRPLPSA